MTPQQEQQAIVAAKNAVDILHALDCTQDMEPDFRVTMHFGADGYCIRLAQLIGNDEWLLHTIPDSGEFIAADIFAAIAMARDLRAKTPTPTTLKK